MFFWRCLSADKPWCVGSCGQKTITWTSIACCYSGSKVSSSCVFSHNDMWKTPASHVWQRQLYGIFSIGKYFSAAGEKTNNQRKAQRNQWRKERRKNISSIDNYENKFQAHGVHVWLEEGSYGKRYAERRKEKLIDICSMQWLSCIIYSIQNSWALWKEGRKRKENNICLMTLLLF